MKYAINAILLAVLVSVMSMAGSITVTQPSATASATSATGTYSTVQEAINAINDPSRMPYALTSATTVQVTKSYGETVSLLLAHDITSFSMDVDSYTNTMTHSIKFDFDMNGHTIIFDTNTIVEGMAISLATNEVYSATLNKGKWQDKFELLVGGGQ